MENTIVKPYQPKNHVRIVTAASLFDGHDAAINIMRRIMQASGAEVIHLGHNRSVQEIVECAIQEDVQGIAITSYQGGHVEFFKYMYDLLNEKDAGHIKIFGGGGGTILPAEIAELHAYGITRLYSPDDGREMGLQGMINDLLEKCDFPTKLGELNGQLKKLPLSKSSKLIARLISEAENNPEAFAKNDLSLLPQSHAPVLGITGTGGAGKSSLVDELIRRFLLDFQDKTLAVISIDPSKRRTGGALLGDRIRMNSLHPDIARGRVYMRSLATRQSNLALSKHISEAINICKAAHFDLIIVETSGIGQSDTEIIEHSDVSLYVMTSEYGAATQLEKIDMLDYADLIAINKFDKRGSLDALRDVKKQYRRNHQLWDVAEEALPVFGTIASQFNDAGMNALYLRLLEVLEQKQANQEYWTKGQLFNKLSAKKRNSQLGPTNSIMPPDRVRYLAEIVENARNYEQFVNDQAAIARQLYQLEGTIKTLTQLQLVDKAENLRDIYREIESRLHFDCKKLLETWPETVKKYRADKYQFKVRDKIIEQDLWTETLSHLKIPKIALPKYNDWGDILKWVLTENVPGEFPFTAGVFPLKREGEDPTRMFAGEGGPERTNRRFHYLSKQMPAKRLSTAFDSVTLYGEDPDFRPDIYGKVGNSGVSICNLDDAKKLYSGFDLCDPSTSVSMTINGPAPIVLGFFLNAAIDQQCEKWLQAQSDICFEPKVTYNGTLPEGHNGLGLGLLGTTGDQVLPLEVYQKIKAETLRQVRGTVQADILKEDQAQNTCIFSTEFALKLMGDIQQYFIDNQVRNFYSVSISGYHIAEAGANPISQLAFTLSNGFTFVEYYLSRGMHIDDFAPNLSFFFSNGMDPEYTVLGRVARRIWGKALKNKYKGNERSQKLKYHIQTSGRSLHAQEIAFNDIRTTLQALLAIYDNCNSLHTNAYDEAITTPTEESVRRAMAIQLIINREFGLAKNENPLQGAFIVEELTDLVEEAVYQEFLSISERGGVLGAMERMYQRSKIQEESMHYEMQKHTGALPIIGVNTFLDERGSPTILPAEVIRSTEEEKQYAVSYRQDFQTRHKAEATEALNQLKEAALQNANLFESLMEATKVCTLGQISAALYEVGGQYRRNM
ncbi:methylmalonyl-CoA mutase family protein [Runella sp. MFBS21]|uniref:methylmalonyl-CoA mutase family protein n=1 Tax=Runella sp. MFBS21 TaxID=3034018 RepID=UPI0023F992CB|nr:methylmalonyl-CoA mutase family protein [Runella sp. MFBS21]MDF7819171.1 methylmalonyl-CoA mutase family protein [Runella sp. MFBS21]